MHKVSLPIQAYVCSIVTCSFQSICEIVQINIICKMRLRRGQFIPEGGYTPHELPDPEVCWAHGCNLKETLWHIIADLSWGKDR